MCLSRLPDRAGDAATATHRAIQLSDKDPKSRKAASHNLGQILKRSWPSHVPGPTEEGSLADAEGRVPRCKLFDAVPGCSERVWGCFHSQTGLNEFARFARDPRTLLTRPIPEGGLWGDPPEAFEGDALVIRDEAVESTRAGPSFCYFETACSVVWADACTGRVGYSCVLKQGPYPPTPSSEDGIPCTTIATPSGEIKLR